MGALPDWCEPLFDAQSMRAIDGWAIERRGVCSLDLMEHAGLGVARITEQLVPEGTAVVLCGKGNNGGDGLVTARLLREAGRQVSVLCTAPAQELTGDAARNLERLPGPEPLYPDGDGQLDFGALRNAVLIVDALLGTGFQGEPRGVAATAIAAINNAHATVISVDVPSGVDACTGVVGGEAVRAKVTVTLHAGKVGLWINPGKAHAGDVRVLDIGIPRDPPVATDIGLIRHSVLDQLPHRGADSNKFSSGHVLVVGGSPGLTGAPAMASLAALRAGAGYVTACVPESLRQILDVQLLEVMTLGLADEDGALTPEGLFAVKDSLARAGCLALGPGLGRNPQSVRFARELAREASPALVLDADGLNAHAGLLAGLTAREAPTVLTPHAGELARLLGLDSEQVQKERLAHARQAAEQAGAIVVLKGDDTLVIEQAGCVAVSRGNSPALATAGTGDVLTGTIAALLAQGMEPFAAAAAGVELHAQAGREAARRQGSAEGVIAGDVIAALPAVRCR